MLKFYLFFCFSFILYSNNLPSDVLHALDHELSAPFHLSNVKKDRLLDLIKDYQATTVIVEKQTTLLLFLIDRFIFFESIEFKKIMKSYMWQQHRLFRRVVFGLLAVYFGIKSFNIFPRFDELEFISNEFICGGVFFLAIFIYYALKYHPQAWITDYDYEAIFAAIDDLIHRSKNDIDLEKIINSISNSRLKLLLLEKAKT